MWIKDYDLDKEYTGKELKDISLCDDDTVKGAIKDIAYLWMSNKDIVHTNFYYSLLRTALIGLKTGEIKPIIIRGMILNLILFTISFIMFYLLMLKLTANHYLLSGLGVLLAFLSTATISNTLYMRNYQLQETMNIIFLYFFVKTFSNNRKILILEKQWFVDLPVFSLLGLTASLTLLTGYYAMLFIGFFGLYVVCYSIKQQNSKNIVFYILVLIFAVILSQFLYTKYLVGYVSERAVETNNTLMRADNLKKSFAGTINVLETFYFNPFVLIVLLLLIMAALFLKHGKQIGQPNNIVWLFTSLSSFLYLMVVIFIAPIKTLRYVMPVFPFFTFLPIIILKALNKKVYVVIFSVLLIASFAKTAFNTQYI
jgi:hypothetical protein